MRSSNAWRAVQGTLSRPQGNARGEDRPQEEPGQTFSLASALYIADHLASRKAPPDDFALEEWNMDYLRAIGCEGDIPAWEAPSFGH